MKKIIVSILVVLMLFGCKGSTDGDTDTDSSPTVKETGDGKMFCTLNPDTDTAVEITVTYQGDEMKTVEGSSYTPIEADMVDVTLATSSIFTSMFDSVEGFDLTMDANADRTALVTIIFVDYDKLDLEGWAELAKKMGTDAVSLKVDDDRSLSNYRKSLEADGFNCK